MITVDVVLVVLVTALIAATVRAMVGPTYADRALALDFGFAVFVAGLALLAVRLPNPSLIDLVLAGTLLGFLSTVAFARLAERRPR
jgi:multicomponent Na+:H+ antiporter subunit F